MQYQVKIEKTIADQAFAVLTIMIAELQPAEKESLETLFVSIADKLT